MQNVNGENDNKIMTLKHQNYAKRQKKTIEKNSHVVFLYLN